MSHRNLRDELRDVFDGISEPAHPALSARIRQRLADGSAPTTRTPRLAVALAIATAAIIVSSLIFVSRHSFTPPTTPAGQPIPSPAVTATAPPASPTPVPVVPPGDTATPEPAPSGSASAPPAAGGPAFQCAAQSGGASPIPSTGVTSARAAAQTGYERFVLQFDGPLPQYEVAPQASATFIQDPSGASVTLAGSAGLVVRVRGAQAHGTFTGATDIRPDGTVVLREARQLGDFEGVVTWGLGLSRATCFRAFTLTGPSRLIVDVQT